MSSPTKETRFSFSNLIEVAKLPEKYQQLLVELDLLSGVR